MRNALRLRGSRSTPSRKASAAVGLGLTLLLAQAATAQAASTEPYAINTFEGTVVRSNGTTYADKAGEHPDFGIVDFSFKTNEYDEPYGVTRDIHVDTPAGLIPNPAAFPTCTDAQLDNMADTTFGAFPGQDPTDVCPPEAQVGVQELTVRGDIPDIADIFQNPETPGRYTLKVQMPVYNMTRKPGQVGRFAFLPKSTPMSGLVRGDTSRVDIVGRVRNSGDHGVGFDIVSPSSLPVVRAKQTFWGTPGADSHTEDRGRSCAALKFSGFPANGRTMSLGCVIYGIPDIPAYPPDTNYPGDPGSEGDPAPRVPVEDKTTSFLTNPTLCAGKLRTTMSVTSYDGETLDTGFDTPYGALDCQDVPFDPSVTFGSDGPVHADSAVALKVGLHVPQSESTDTLGTAHVKDVKVQLPEGFSINPSAANGLETCNDAQLGQDSDNAVACPPGSKVGTVSIASPVIDSPLTGELYVGQPQPGARYRLFLDAEGHGVSIRLKGDIKTDPTTGQLTATFESNPQLPFSDLDLQFEGGDRGIIAAPQTCGTKTGSAAITSFASSTPVDRTASLEVTGCDGFGFSPGFGVAPASLKSGAFSPLSVAFSRADGNQLLSGISATLPQGMTAKLKGVIRCSEGEIAAESCPLGSQLGSVSVKAGTGAAPYALSGPVYLTNGYKGGSFGMVAIIHAVAGPYDLGNVVVRQALRIDPETAQVTVDSDPLPQIKEGIPLRLRDLSIDVTRAGFLRNPTSCSTGFVGAKLTSLQGAVATPSAKLDFTGCKDLKFGPKIKLALGNKTQTGKFKHPRLTAVVQQNTNEAGLKSTSVTLPKALALAADNAQGLCETADALADKCPKASIVGSAVAETPILDKVLRGPVYFVKGERKDPKTGRVIKTLPTLYVALRGETAINLRATTSVVRKQLVTTFPAIPDQPISKFTLNINGGKHGIIATTRSLCGGKLTGSASFAGQNGAKPKASKPRITTPCIPGKKQR